MARDVATDFINDRLQDATQITMELIKMIDDLLKNTKTHAGTENDKKMVEAISNHLKKGGSLVSDDIDVEYAKKFEALLRGKGIPFVAVSNIDPETKTPRTIFLTRDVDSSIVEKIRVQFNESLEAGLGEIEPKQFLLNREKGQSIQAVGGLSEVDMTVMRQNLSGQSFQYAFDYDRKKNTYTLLYDEKNQSQVDRAMSLTAYDLSGNRGELIRSEIEKEISEKRAFKLGITPVAGETIYVVDAENPANFIAINQGSYSMHTLRDVKQPDQNGDLREVIKDVSQDKKAKPYNKEKILSLSESLLQKPIILSQSEMELISKVNGNGSLEINDPEHFLTHYKNMVKMLSLRQGDLNHSNSLQKFVSEEHTYGLSQISESDMQKISSEIERLGLKNVAVYKDQLAYTNENKGSVEQIVNNVLYRDLSKEKVFEAKCHYEERGEISLDSDDTYLIKDMKNPGYQFKLDEHNFTIYNLRSQEAGEKQEPIVISRTSAQFRDSVIPMLIAMENPVVLKNEETLLIPEERTKIEISRTGDAPAINAKEFVFNDLQSERDNFVSDNFSLDEASKKQLDASHYKEQWVKKTYKVDRNLLEKVADHTLDQKIVNSYARKDVPDKEKNRDSGYDIDR